MTDKITPAKIISVYVLIDPRNGQVRYVGVTSNPKQRLRDHIRTAKKEKHHRATWINSLLSEGLTPVMDIIDETNNEEWQQCEIAWIAHYRGLGYDLVNATDGGEGTRGCIPSKETRRKQSESGKNRPPITDEARKNISRENNHNYGKSFSEEHRKRISDSNPNKRPVLQYDKFGHFIRQWDGIKTASRETGIYWQNITACCRRNGYKSAGGYVWRYADDPLLGEYPMQLKLDLE